MSISLLLAANVTAPQHGCFEPQRWRFAVSHAARALGIARSSMVRYDNGERELPDALFDRVYGLLVRHQAETGKLIGKLGDLRDGRKVAS